MSATVAAALKKIVVAILTDKKARKVVLGIILGILIILVMPLAAIIAIFNGDINIDTNRLQTLVVQNLSAEEQAKLQRVEDLMYEIEDRMTEAGFDNQRVKEAQVLYVLALSDYSEADGFVDKLVGCFADGQTDAQLISAVNSAFGTNLSVDEFTKVMSAIRAVYISTCLLYTSSPSSEFPPKVLTPAQMEEIRTTDFFDMILPGSVQFLSDHYVVGDSYRSVWVIREYPPSTEEQAILSQLADRSGVTLRIYHRLVESMEQRKIIQNATRRNKLKSGGNDVNDTICNW